MIDNLDKYTDLEIFMELHCTHNNKMRLRLLEEIRFRKWSWLKKTFLKSICKIAMLALFLREIQYDSFMYNEKEIRRSFLMFIPLFFIIIGMIILYVYYIVKSQ